MMIPMLICLTTSLILCCKDIYIPRDDIMFMKATTLSTREDIAMAITTRPTTAKRTAYPRPRIVGAKTEVPLFDGSHTRYVNLDSAASTPPMVKVGRAVEEFLPWYSSVPRGAGYKSRLSTHLYEHARDSVMRFVGASPSTHV